MKVQRDGRTFKLRKPQDVSHGVGQVIGCAVECDKGTKECDRANSRVDANM